MYSDPINRPNGYNLAKKSCDFMTVTMNTEISVFIVTVMCNYEQTALNKARLFAPIEYLFATKDISSTPYFKTIVI